MVDLPGDPRGAARLNIYQTSDCNFIVPCISCRYFYRSFVADICKFVMKDVHKQIENHYTDAVHMNELLTLTALNT